jgi:glutathione synthase/RimK-type ligase-like ATP-grasp enzyme
MTSALSSNPPSQGTLILTNPGDFHAFVVGEALRRKGHCVWEWYTSDFPSLQKASALLTGEGIHWELSGPELIVEDIRPKAVWVRSPSTPVVPSSVLTADQPFAARECRKFLNSLFQSAGWGAFWVNPIAGASRADLKMEQLKAAVRAGLRVPRTLCSNDPARIRQFIRDNHESVIYKAFYPASWETADGVAVLFSSHVTEADLPDDTLLQAVPGIYQQTVPKAYELRVTAIGMTLVAAKLYSQTIPSAKLDWRAAREPVPLEPTDIPESLANACRAIMADLGIVFGCFDLIITPDGEAVFLEVNEAGSFLWIEEQNPEFRLLDVFCEFLLRGRTDFKWSESASSVRFRDVEAAALHRMKNEAPRLHVEKPLDTQQDEPQRYNT